MNLVFLTDLYPHVACLAERNRVTHAGVFGERHRSCLDFMQKITMNPSINIFTQSDHRTIVPLDFIITTSIKYFVEAVWLSSVLFP
jgi:hypothetical protein